MNYIPSSSQLGRFMLVVLALGISLFAATYLWLSPNEFSFKAQRVVYAGNVFEIRLHVASGIVALCLGSLQMVPAFRRKRNLHKLLGRVYLACVLVGGTSGLVVAQYAWGGASNTAAFSALALLWLLSTSRAFFYIRKGNVELHRIWMLRSYAFTFTAVTLRLQLVLFQGFTPISFQEAYLIVPWLSWIVNLVAVEWIVIPKLAWTR